MAAFHVRDIPPELLERLRERARREGRSMNAEILAILDRNVWALTPEEWLEQVEQFREKYARTPLDPSPEALIREDRDSR